jgi:hypothetical protein
MALADAQLVDCRRYCGYEAFGSQVTPASGYRFFVAYGQLEYRMANLTTNEQAVVTTMLTNLNTLEAAIVTAGGNLDTDSAGPWKHNRNEVADRVALYRFQRIQLAQFFGVPPGPALASSGGQLVV